MVARFGFIAAKKGVWEVVKISTGPWVQYADYEQALAEKDREIDCLSEQVNALNKMFRRKHHAYQQLMEKAVRFSECLNDDCKCTISEVNADPACAYVRAREFLESPEVQAWKERP